MNDDQRGFFKNLLHTTLQAAIMSVIWRLPTGILIGVIGLILFLVMWFKLY